VSAPDAKTLFDALDATWPAAAFHSRTPWVLREGAGGGQRVSAATATAAVCDADIAEAEADMCDFGQRPLFMVQGDDPALDALLEARGYEVVDPVLVYLAPLDHIAAPLKITAAMPSWPPLAIQRELWQAGGIGPGRLAVMDRARGPKRAVLGRRADSPCGTAFVAMSGEIAMVHALEVSPEARRGGVGRAIMAGAANWAGSEGARWMAVVVTVANVAANALYGQLGMTVVTRYHYRRAPEGPA
jgi:GNAT superfamily N-acetyltransferase